MSAEQSVEQYFFTVLETQRGVIQTMPAQFDARLSLTAGVT